MSEQCVKFDSLSKQEQRIEIASDVIKQLDAERIIATSGTYLDSLASRLVRLGSIWTDKVDKEIIKYDMKCRACALGSMFISLVLKNDGVTVGDIAITPYTNLMTKLREVFNIEELLLIEAYFEGHDSYTEYYYKYIETEDRLRAIMQNIVDNKGTFIP